MQDAPTPTSSGFDPKVALLGALAAITLWYVWVVWRSASQRAKEGEPVKPTPALIGVGAIANFFDTLGIGSFATTTSMVRHWKLFADEYLPGTLNAGHTLATITQAFIYTRIVPVEATTLILMIIAAVVGAWLGAGVVARLPRRGVQLGMGWALLGAAVLLVLSLLKLLPTGGELLGIQGGRLAAGLVGNFLLGALMTIGIGLYAPCMILVSLLGMNPTAAFPIMMGSCAFLMPVAGTRFIRERKVDMRALVGFIVGGVPATLVAAFIVKSLPLEYVKWLVVIVVVYTSFNMIRAAHAAKLARAAEAATA